MANGLANNTPLKASSAGAARFATQLFQVMYQLAHAMVADGEGATKVVRILIRGAKNAADARRAAYGIANSQLVRTSFFGSDPNWGRVLAALARSGATCDPSRVDIAYGGTTVCRRGQDAGLAAQRRAKQVLRRRELTLTVSCHAGSATHNILCSDLTLDYVKLNSNYRS